MIIFHCLYYVPYIGLWSLLLLCLNDVFLSIYFTFPSTYIKYLYQVLSILFVFFYWFSITSSISLSLSLSPCLLYFSLNLFQVFPLSPFFFCPLQHFPFCCIHSFCLFSTGLVKHQQSLSLPLWCARTNTNLTFFLFHHCRRILATHSVCPLCMCVESDCSSSGRSSSIV